METTAKNMPSLRDLGYYDENETAGLYGVVKLTLRNWRSLGVGPPFVKVQRNKFAYPIQGVKKDLERRTVRPKAS